MPYNDLLLVLTAEWTLVAATTTTAHDKMRATTGISPSLKDLVLMCG